MKTALALAFLFLLTACGNKVPESEAAKKLGNIPKQTEDKVRSDVTKALQRGVERDREADQKNN